MQAPISPASKSMDHPQNPTSFNPLPPHGKKSRQQSQIHPFSRFTKIDWAIITKNKKNNTKGSNKTIATSPDKYSNHLTIFPSKPSIIFLLRINLQYFKNKQSTKRYEKKRKRPRPESNNPIRSSC